MNSRRTTKRSALTSFYLEPETPSAVPYISTGLVVGLEDNRVETLARSMDERRAETGSATLGCPFRSADDP